MDKKEVTDILRELAKNNNCRYEKPDADVMDMLIQFANLIEKKHEQKNA